MFKTSNLGYPRIGIHREWKKTLEDFWAHKMDEDHFIREMKKIRLQHYQVQKDKGIDLIPVGDFSFYDQVLDTAVMFGLIPKRFQYEGGTVPLSTYFAMARGSQEAVACEMTKWFNTNYHYIVPEIESDTSFQLIENRPLQYYREAKESLNILGKPVIIGPFTFLTLAKGYTKEQFSFYLEQLLPLYQQLLQELADEGVEWVQIDEPALVSAISQNELDWVKKSYATLSQGKVPNIMLQTYFEAVDQYEQLVQLPVDGLGLDFVAGKEQLLTAIQTHGFPQDKVLGVGLIDGRNIWKAQTAEIHALLQSLTDAIQAKEWWIQPSCSLLHTPITKENEKSLPASLYHSLSFANEKLDELAQLKHIWEKDAITVEDNGTNTSMFVTKTEVQEEYNSLTEQDFTRPLPYAERKEVQADFYHLPTLPTTTIGSFPQTKEVREARKNWRSQKWSDETYDQFVREEVAKWIQLQEELELDILVHGEFERTDMVEYFGEKLGNMAVTQNAWVQSYGSRCVKPPIIYGDVYFQSPMTVKESKYAQSCTKQFVKGMLTGPITILQWSFVRDDIPRQEVAYQIALALRKEIQALEEAGIHIIQVDEPALREGLPLKKEEWGEYLAWAVNAFRLTTSSVNDTTQIHTHMCYSQFEDIIEAIQQMEADVISIESSRSHGELIQSFDQIDYEQGIGLGVYDIHSPRVPRVDEMTRFIEKSLESLHPSQFWINPDCGLKTRTQKETLDALKHMVQAAKQVRQKLNVPHQ